MVDVPKDINLNYLAFSKKFPREISKNVIKFRGNQKLIESYARVAALNSVKVDLVSHNFREGAARFFFEAHNDALVSHVNASFGSWRPALQALRSFFENTLASVFFQDHPVELKKWEMGKFRISPRELRDYVVDHPSVLDVGVMLNLKIALDSEYSTLSQAVHGSNSLFRMSTSDGKTNYATASVADLGKWAARERQTIDLCTCVLVAVLHEFLDGAKLAEVRKSLSFALQKNSRTALKTKLGISIQDPPQ